MIAAALLLALQAAPAGGGPAVPPQQRYQQMRQLGMSEAGVAVLQRMAAPDPDAPAYAARRQALRERLRAVAAARPLDVEGVAGLLRAEAQAEGEARTRLAERLAATLRALPDADRPIFLRVVLAQGATQRTGPAVVPVPRRPAAAPAAPPAPAR